MEKPLFNAQTVSISVPKIIHEEMMKQNENYNLYDLMTFLLDREALRMTADEELQRIIRQEGMKL